jgi:transcriptional regulator of acetoin/glycerol metabolism
MHGFRALFADNVLRLPPWNKRLYDLPIVLAAKAEAANIDRARLTAAFVERVALAGWAGGAERLDTLLADAGQEGPLEAAVVAAQTPRLQAGARLPLTAVDPDLARSRLADALARGHGSVAAAARILGVTRQCVYREALRLGLEVSRASHN